MIEISGLSKTWDNGACALDHIDLTIPDGEVFAFVGRSGAGKSTLLRCINGLEPYQSGSLKVDGQEVGQLNEGQLRELRRDMGMIFQHFSLLERQTVRQNVALPMKCWHRDKAQADKKVSELLELVGLQDRADARPKNLSGGQKQRVAIARALTLDPKFLLCDEATSALDPNTTNSIIDLLLKINRELGITIVFVSHQMEVVRAACQSMCILEKGVVQAKGKVEDIFFDEPPSLAGLLGMERRDLPSSGINIQVACRIDQTGGGELLTRMSTELGYAFPLVDGQILPYRGSKVGIFVINVDDARYERVARYLNASGVRWKKLA